MRVPSLSVAPLLCLGLVAPPAPPAPAAAVQEGATYSGQIVDEEGDNLEACFIFSATAPGLLTVIKERGTDDLTAWAHTNHNKSKKWFMATGTPGVGAAIALFGKITGGGRRLRGDAIDELGGTFTFRATRTDECPLD